MLLLFTIFLHLCISARYVTFTTNLTLSRQKINVSRLPQSVPQSVTLASLLLVGWLSVESPENYLSTLIHLPDFYCRNMFSFVLRFREALFQIFFTMLSIYMLYLVITLSADILCLLVFQSWCQSLTKNSP